MPALKYRVENATVGNVQRKVEVDGQTGLFTVARLMVELVPIDHDGGVIRLDLAHDTEGYPEGAEFTLSLKPVKKEA